MIKKRIWMQQPQGAVTLHSDWVAALNPATKTAIVENTSYPVYIGETGPCAIGVCQTALASTSYQFYTRISIPDHLVAKTAFTFLALLMRPASLGAGAGGRLFTFGGYSVDGGVEFTPSASHWTIRLFWQTDSTTRLDISCNIADIDKFTLVRCDYNGLTARILVDGVVTASGNSSIGPGYYQSYFSGTQSSWTMRPAIGLIAFSNKFIFDTTYPWQIFRAPDSHIFVPIGGSSTNIYTIYPTGSLAFVSTTPTIKTNVLPTSGKVTYSGTNSIIFSNGATTYTITPSGSISYINSNILEKDRVLYASGNITYSGNVVTQHIRLLSVSGLITYTGSVNNIKIKIVNPTGKISYTGTNPIYVPGSGTVTTRLPLTGAGN